MFSSDPAGRRRWLPNYVAHRFIVARRDAGPAHFRLHDLRHFMDTQMLSAHIPLATVAQRLNHTRISTGQAAYTDEREIALPASG